MSSLEVVTFKWKPRPGYRTRFSAVHVNLLHRMVQRHYAGAFRFSAITDDAQGIDPSIRIVPLWSDLASVPSPFSERHPACYRRLKLFAPEARELIGERIVCLDLDVVVTGDLAPLWDRSEDVVFYKGQWGSVGVQHSRNPYNGSMFMLTAGTRTRVWTQFDAMRSPKETRAAGYGGSDQAWFAHVLGRDEAVWTRGDGVYSYRNDIMPNGNKLPEGARMVMFHGRHNPWDRQLQRIGWIRNATA